ncbi:MAG: PPE family protein [Mycobacterium sp.]
MDLFAPPEIISALIHTGPGAGSMIEAAGAWQQVAVELESSAAGYAAAVSGLIETWSGPSAMAMAQSVQPYLIWLRDTAQQAQQLAASTEAAAVAFSFARAAVVTPAQVAANRTLLAQLLATNRFGSNTAAIAQVQAEYEAMWQAASAAMVRYQAATAQATSLQQFTSPLTMANPAAAVAPATATTANATANATANGAATLQDLSLAAFNPNAGWFGYFSTWGNQFISSGFPINALGVQAQLATAQGVQSVGGEVGQGLAEGESALGSSEADVAFGAARAQAAAAIKAAGSPTAALGAGVTIGKLTAPPGVVGLLPAAQSPVQLASSVSPLAAGNSGLAGMPIMPMMVPPPVSAGSGWRKRKQPNSEEREYSGEYSAERMTKVVQRPPSGG